MTPKYDHSVQTLAQHQYSHTVNTTCSPKEKEKVTIFLNSLLKKEGPCFWSTEAPLKQTMTGCLHQQSTPPTHWSNSLLIPTFLQLSGDIKK